MTLKVAVWGSGNVGRPAVRAVHAHRELELAGLIVSSDSKAGRDAGEIAGIGPIGVTATKDINALIDAGLDCVVYTASSEMRGEEAMQDLLNCLSRGVNVVSTAFYALLHSPLTPEEVKTPIEAACREGNSSVFISGIDPGWAMDLLPLVASGMCSDISEIRSREIFNYALYDQPQVVREVIGFGGSMDELPLMLLDIALEMVWAPMLHIVAKGLGTKLDKVFTRVERRPLEQSIDVPGMGHFEAGTQGAFRFEVVGVIGGEERIVLEHVTRIDDSCAPDWPYPPEGQGCHQLIISGTPNLHISLHGEDPVEPGPAGGGNASAANRIVNAIPAVCASDKAIVDMLDLPAIYGGAQLKN